MLARVYFLSRYLAEKMHGRSDTVVVSIHDRHFSPKLHDGFRDVLTLYFDDYDPVRDGTNPKMDAFTDEHATKLRKWLSPHLQSDAPLIFMTSCYAGVSRSAAIAWWVHKEFNVPLGTTFPVKYLNAYVLKCLNPAIAPPNDLVSQCPNNSDILARVFNPDEWPPV